MLDRVLRPKSCQVVFEATDVREAAEFWRQLLGLVYREGQEPPGSGEPTLETPSWLDLDDPDGTPRLAFQRVGHLTGTTWPDPAVPQQVHLDLTFGDPRELEVMHERVLALGGRSRFDRSGDPDEPLRVYVDPAGHTFCILLG